MLGTCEKILLFIGAIFGLITMLKTNERILLFIGAILCLTGFLGSSFKVSALQTPSIGKWPRVLTVGTSLILMATAVSQIVFLLFYSILWDCTSIVQPAKPSPLIGTSWQLVGIIVNGQRQPPLQPDQIVTFESSCKIAGYDGCNEFGLGVILFRDDRFITRRVSTTLRDCMNLDKNTGRMIPEDAELPEAVWGHVIYEIRAFRPGRLGSYARLTSSTSEPVRIPFLQGRPHKLSGWVANMIHLVYFSRAC